MTPDDRSPAPTRPEDDPSGIDDLLAGDAMGDLTPAECERLAVLLERDPALRARLDEFRTTLQLLPLALPAVEAPPERLRRRLLRPVRRGGSAGPVIAEGRWRPALRGSLMPLLLGFALLAVGLQLLQTRQQLARIEQRLATPPAPGPTAAVATVGRHLDLVGATPGIQARGEVLVTGNGTHNVLMLDDLPAPPAGHVYRLWAEVEGRQVGCVSFVPTEQGHVGMLIPATPTTLARRVSVSVEPDPMGRAPTGPMVLRSNL